MDDRCPRVRRMLLVLVMLLAWMTVPSGASRADGGPAPPTDVQLGWTTLGPVPEEMQPAVRITWQGADPAATYAWRAEAWTGRTWSPREPMGSTAAGVLEASDFAFDFPYRSTVRVAVHAIVGGVSGPDAYSPSFDTQGPLPLLREVRPHADGRVTLTWTPQLPGPDTTPGDPLDLDIPFRYQVVQFAAIGEAYLDVGPSTTALSGTVVPGTPGRLGVAPETEWTAGTGLDFVDFSQPVDYVVLSGTVVTARIPGRTSYGRTLIARGTIRRVDGGCNHLECIRIREPSPGRRVVLQARRGPTEPWSVVDRTTSGERGRYRLSAPSTGTREYRVLVRGIPWAGGSPRNPMAGATTRPTTGTTVTRVISARFARSMATRGRVSVALVEVTPAFHQRARLQRKTATGWLDVARTRLSRGRGSVEVTATVRGSARYRWVVSGVRVDGLPVRGTTTRSFVLRTR